jgi:AcrR family transcriptional regulator
MSDGPQARAGARRARNEEARQAKLQAILDAALDVFAEKGFADARLEDVAARAGVAKGTLYLYAESKQALFEALVQSGIVAPLVAIEAQVLALDAPAEMMLRALFAALRREVLETRRKEIVRLVIAEAGRFPDVAAFYYREVVGRGMTLLRGVAERAVERGEFRSDELVRFPQLAIAPALVALLWANLFERFEPLDAEAMLDAHLGLLMRALKGSGA